MKEILCVKFIDELVPITLKKCFLIFIFELLASIIIILISEIMLLKVKPKCKIRLKSIDEKKSFLLYFTECIISIIFISFMLFAVNDYLFTLVIAIYLIFTMAEKYLMFNLMFKKYELKYVKNRNSLKKESIKLKDCLLILVSPDYFFTKVMKNDLNIYDGNKSKKGIRANYIECCNHFNVIVSFIFAIIFSLAYALKNEPLKIIISSLLIYRIISRCVEIIISFVKDVTSKDIKQSNLKSKNRIVLAFYSIFEICIFAFCTLLISAKCDFGDIESLFESLGVVINATSSNYLISKVLLIIESITCTSLIGIVITTYISSVDTCTDLDNKEVSYLKVCKKTGVLIIPMNDLNNGNYELIIEEKNFLNHEIEFIDINGDLMNLNSFTNEYLQLIGSNKYRFTKNGRFSLDLNQNDKVLTIYIDGD